MIFRCLMAQLAAEPRMYLRAGEWASAWAVAGPAGGLEAAWRIIATLRLEAEKKDMKRSALNRRGMKTFMVCVLAFAALTAATGCWPTDPEGGYVPPEDFRVMVFDGPAALPVHAE